jgi:predicted metal-dependent hydrolase
VVGPLLDPPDRTDPEELALISDPRLKAAVDLFNAGEWYACHDGLEELWHETAGAMRPVLQGILQIAVGQLHLSSGNNRGAVILTGEGLGRLQRCPDQALGLDLQVLRAQATVWLQALQQNQHTDQLPRPSLQWLQSDAAL